MTKAKALSAYRMWMSVACLWSAAVGKHACRAADAWQLLCLSFTGTLTAVESFLTINTGPEVSDNSPQYLHIYIKGPLEFDWLLLKISSQTLVWSRIKAVLILSSGNSQLQLLMNNATNSHIPMEQTRNLWEFMLISNLIFFFLTKKQTKKPPQKIFKYILKHYIKLHKSFI